MDRATYGRRSGVIPRTARQVKRCGGSHLLAEDSPGTVFDGQARDDVLAWVTRQLCWEHHLDALHAAAAARSSAAGTPR